MIKYGKRFVNTYDGSSLALFKTEYQLCNIKIVKDRMGGKCKCGIEATYGLEGKRTHCAKCKTKDMYRLHGVCIHCKKTLAMYGTTSKRTHCIGCKTEEMTRCSGMCTRCNTTRSTKKFKDLCTTCFCIVYPDEKFSRRVKSKELRVVAELRSTIFNDFAYIKSNFDKRIEGGCSKRRPDIYSQCGAYDVCTEIDENQHSNYDTTCEVARVNNIFSDAGVPIWFVRFNPDAYTDSKGVKHKSMFKFDDKGNISLNEKEVGRFKVLQDTLKKVFTTSPNEDCLVSVIELFYNGYDVS